MRRSLPAPYAALLGRLEHAEIPTTLGRRVEIVLRSQRSSPWTNGATPVAFYAGAGVLWRVDGWFRPPDGLAARIEEDAGIRAAPVDSSFPWAPLAGGLAGAVALLAAAALLLRRAGRSIAHPGRPRLQ